MEERKVCVHHIPGELAVVEIDTMKQITLNVHRFGNEAIESIVASIRRDWPLHLVFIVLLALRVYVFSTHEMWRDEVLHFLRVRDAESYFSLLQGVKYERSLALWPSLIYGLKSIGLDSIMAVKIMHLVFSGLTLGFIIYGIRRIPLLIGGLVASSYLLLYEYTAITRKYSLAILFLVIFMTLEIRGKKGIIVKAILLALMANSSIQGAMLAVALGTYLFFNTDKNIYRQRMWLTGILSAALIFSAYMAWAPSTMYEPNLSQYRESAFATMGIPRLLETISHTVLNGFYYFPQIYNIHWWSLTSLWERFLMVDYRMTYTIAIAAVSIALWSMIKIFKANTGLGIALVVLWGSNLVFFMVFLPGGARHLGILVFGTLAIFALAIIKHGRYSCSRPERILLLALLFIQAFAGIWAVYAENKQTFSQGQNVAEWIQENHPGKNIIAYPDFAGTTITAFTGGFIESLESGTQVSFIQMDTSRNKEISPYLIENLTIDKQGEIFISPLPYEPRLLNGEIAVEHLKSFDTAVEFWESGYHVYLVRPVTDTTWKMKWIPVSLAPGNEARIEYISESDAALIETSGTNVAVFSYEDVHFNNSSVSIAEIKLQLFKDPVSNHDACLFSLQNGDREGKLSFFKDRIEIRDGNKLMATHYVDTVDSPHTYRTSIYQNHLNVSIDGIEVFDAELLNVNHNKSIIFGDGSPTRNENFGAFVHYIAYTITDLGIAAESEIQP